MMGFIDGYIFIFSNFKTIRFFASRFPSGLHFVNSNKLTKSRNSKKMNITNCAMSHYDEISKFYPDRSRGSTATVMIEVNALLLWNPAVP